MSNSKMSGLKPAAAPLSANFSSQSGTLWIVLVHDSFPGCNGAKSEIFPLQLGATHARYVKHRGELRTNQTKRDAQRWIHAQKHLPLPHRFSNLLRAFMLAISAWHDGKGRQWGGETEPQCQKSKVLLITPDQNPPLWVTENVNAVNSQIKAGIQIMSV